MNLYVIGPITGRDDLNRQAFEEARFRLCARGHNVTIPHDVVDETLPWPDCMRKSIWAMLSGMTDGVAHLDCEESPGSSIEKKIAATCGMQVMSVSEWLRL